MTKFTHLILQSFNDWGPTQKFLSNSLFSGVLKGLLVPSSKITKLLDTPCNTPSCWKVSGKAFLMQKTQQKRLDGFRKMQQTSWATGNKSHYSENTTWKHMFHMFLHACTHGGSEVIFEKPFWLPSSFHMERCSWCKVLCFTNLWLRILHTRSAWQFIPRFNTFFLPSLQCLADHVFLIIINSIEWPVNYHATSSTQQKYQWGPINGWTAPCEGLAFFAFFCGYLPGVEGLAIGWWAKWREVWMSSCWEDPSKQP